MRSVWSRRSVAWRACEGACGRWTSSDLSGRAPSTLARCNSAWPRRLAHPFFSTTTSVGVASAGWADGARRSVEVFAVASAAAAALAWLSGGTVLAKEKRQESRYQVYVWGRSESMPGGAPGDVLWPKRIEWFEQNEAGWAKIVFGPNFGAALDGRGLLYVWGECPGEEECVGPVAIDVRGEGRGRCFVDVQCSADKIFALTGRGHAIIFEDVLEALKSHSSSSSLAPVALEGRLVPGLPQPGKLSALTGAGGIKSMGIGLEHGCFVTHRGEVYCVGGNEWGQCGASPPRQKGPMGALEDRSRIQVETPMKVTLPAEAGRIVEVAVGGRHTVVRDAAGNVFAFGDDRRIQLGLGDTRTQGIDERNSFGVIRQDLLGGKDTKQDLKRAVTYRYYDPHMQFKPMQTLAPAVYNRPPYPPPSFVACGEDFTIAAHRDSPDWYSKDQETNVLLCCGENGEGQCGRGLQEQQQPWTPVRVPKRSRTVTVACGQAHCLALLTTGELLAWGASLQGQLGNGKRAIKAKPIRIGLQPAQERLAPVNISPQGMPPEFHAPRVEQRPFPGKIVSVSCGFRNSAVICEVPVDQ
mmetsp:Transcript_151821/g.487186  ORF Transcript_151821/g.487186 Transcript_151821/m.487186 type:complete len:582 (+) Transcript_151821:118-1863(+)